MFNKNHQIHLIINKQTADLSDYDTSVRLNSILYNPAEIISGQGDYSFSFDLPATKNNNRIFAYSNQLSVLNKGVMPYKAQLYADEHLLFDGSLTVSSYKGGKYSVNLVVVRVVDYDSIFGESVMSDLDWYIPFDGAVTVNEYNASADSDVTFPLVSYGAFQKVPKDSDDVGNTYTSKFDLDEYNRWYIESFYPSPKVLTTLRKCFEHHGYTVTGDVFDDDILNSIYASVNLSDEQDPLYNIGNPTFGKVDISLSATTSGTPYEQELSFPYEYVSVRDALKNRVYGTTEAYNFATVRLYNLLNVSRQQSGLTVNQAKSYMYQPNEDLIVIPADGFYKIEMEIGLIAQTPQTFSAKQWVVHENTDDPLSEETVTIASDINWTTPVEIQLVRNYDDNLELIKGKWNRAYTSVSDGGSSGRSGKIGTYTEWLTCYPHEDLYAAKCPTDSKLVVRKTKTTDITSSGSTPTRRGGDGGNDRQRNYSTFDMGYIYKDGEIMAYDPAVNPDFIIGHSTMGTPTDAVIRNGKSWTRMSADEGQAFYNNTGYSMLRNTGNTSILRPTDHNANTYPNTPRNTNKIYAMVYLRKNDILQLFAVQRGYDNVTAYNYATDINLSFSIEAASPRSYTLLRQSGYGYSSPTEFDTELRIGNFLNSGTTMSSWVQMVRDAFNLEITVEDKTVNIGRKLLFGERNGNNAIIPIDHKVSTYDGYSDVTWKPIDYPKSMAVRYNIDTEECGFEKSVSPQHINDDDWEEYGDYGYDVIEMSKRDGASEQNLDLALSYCWYTDFSHYDVTSADTKESGQTPVTLNIPVISKAEFLVDGYDYEESLKHDGYGLTQRFWFTPSGTNRNVWLDVYPQESVDLYVSSNYKDGVSLSYKIGENSLLRRYFNVTPLLSSNYVEVDVYLTAEEYKLLKNGARVKFDDDLYYVCDIEGYDPTGNNETKLTLIKNTK